MATPGTFISGIGHVGLMVWLIAGWGMDAEPLRLETMDVSVISGEEFDQLRARTTPEPGDADPQAPVPPVIEETPPPPSAPDRSPAPAPRPEPIEPPQPEAPPPPPPPPVAADVIQTPPPAPAVPEAPQPAPELEVTENPVPPQAPTVASELNAPPPPDAQIDDSVREEVTPDPTAEAEVVQEEQEATAPEETTTAIVPQDLAPTASVRPATRPNRPAPTTPAAQPEPAAPAQDTNDDVAAALADALTAPPPAASAPSVPQGPPMTGAERDSFRISVNRCWNVDPGSVAARVTVEVGFNLDRDGRVINNEVRLISSDGDQGATDIAFSAARRAILRCQSGGYELPADKYDQWQEVVITFDPSGMRMR